MGKQARGLSRGGSQPWGALSRMMGPEVHCAGGGWSAGRAQRQENGGEAGVRERGSGLGAEESAVSAAGREAFREVDSKVPGGLLERRDIWDERDETAEAPREAGGRGLGCCWGERRRGPWGPIKGFGGALRAQQRWQLWAHGRAASTCTPGTRRQARSAVSSLGTPRLPHTHSFSRSGSPS